MMKMMKKEFEPHIEELFKEIPDEQKKLYVKKYNSQNIVALLIGAFVLTICLTGFIVLMCIDEEVPILELFLVIFMAICAGGIMLISIMALKSSAEIKVKRYIEGLEKRKTTAVAGRSEQNNPNFNKGLVGLETQINTNSLKHEIVCINKDIISFLNNEALITISKNLMQEISLPINFLEYIFIPLSTPRNFSTLGTYRAPESSYSFVYPQGLEVEPSPYIEILQGCNGNIKLVNETSLLFAAIIRKAGLSEQYDIPYNTADPHGCAQIKEIFIKFDKTRGTFNALYRQDIIKGEKTIYAYYAFVFLLYYFEKIRLVNLSKKILRENNISENLELQDLIKEFYSIGLDDETIKIVAVYIESDRRSNKPLINILSQEMASQVNSIISEIRDKEHIERLLTGTIRKKVGYNIAQIDLMSGVDFENFVAELFRRLGYQSEVTKSSGDQGVDVIAKKGTQTLAIQAKHYNQAVGNHAIMEVVGGAKFYNANLCYVVTNNYFTKSAKELAATNNVILWDRDKLIEKLNEI